MERIGRVRTEIYDYYHSSVECQQYFSLPENADEFAQYYTSMYLLQDSVEGVQSHMCRGFNDDSSLAFIELCGVMQALIIQQDAISTLHKIVIGEGIQVSSDSNWKAIRRLRNQSTGHPGNHGERFRSFFGRFDFSYGALEYERKDRRVEQPERVTMDFSTLIGGYAEEAAEHLSGVLATMRNRWDSTVGDITFK